MLYWAAVVPPNSTNNAIGPTRPAIPMSGRQDVQSIKPGGRPPQFPSPLTPSVIPDARGSRRRGFSAVCWTKRCGSSPARNRTRRSLPHEDAASQKQPFPRLLLGLSREYPTTSAARIAARRSGWRARGGRSHAPTRRPDRHQYGRAAICKYGNIRVVTRTKSLHRRQTRFPLKVWTEAGVVAPARLNLRPAKQWRIGGMWGERTRRPPA
jgi:hypothetical protein